MPKDTITTKFRVDISDLKKGITEANKNIKLANAQFKAASAGMDNWQKSGEGIKAKLTQLQTVLNNQVNKLKAYKDELSRVENASKENGKRAGELRAKLQELADCGVSKTSEEYKKYEKALNDVEKEQINNENTAERLRTTILNQKAAVDSTVRDMRNWKQSLTDVIKDENDAADSTKELTNAAERLDDSLVNVTDKTSQASDGFTVMKGALSDLIADGIRLAIDKCKELAKELVTVGAGFDTAMSKVEAVSGASGDELGALEEKAKRLGKRTQFTASEVADGFNYMAMAGWNTRDMLEGIDGVLELASSSGTDLATSSDIVTDALTAMGYSSRSSGKLVDVMAATASNANTNVSLMGEAFKYVAPLVGALKYSMEDTSVAIGLMANAGIKGSQAGTSLRSILSRLASPPKETAVAMDKLGLSLTDASGKMKPFSQVMNEMRTGFKNLSETEKSQTASAIAGKNAMSGLLAIVNASPKDFKKLTKAVENSSGAASKMSETMLDNVGGDFTSLESKLEGIQIQVYEKLEPVLRKGMGKISKSLDMVDWDRFGTSGANALDKLMDGFTWLINNGDTVKDVLTGIVGAFIVGKIISYTTAISGMITSTIALTSATEGATVAARLFNAALKANPVGLAVTGIGLLIGAMVALNSAVKESNTEADVRNQKAKEELQVTEERLKAYEDMQEAQREQTEQDLAQVAHIQTLKDELVTLADETGKVKEKDQDRANFILNELNSALGTEYTMTGNQIESYKTLQNEIQKTIDIKRAEILLKGELESYEEAVKNYTKVQEESAKKAQEYSKQQAKASQARIAADIAYSKLVKANAEGEAEYVVQKLNQEYQAKEAAAKKEKETRNIIKKEYKTLEKTLKEYYSNINTYESASAELSAGHTKKAISIIDQKNTAFTKAKDVADKNAKEQKAILEQQVIDTEVNAKLMKERYKEGVEGVTKEMVKTAEKQADAAKKEFQEIGGNITKGIAKGAKKEKWILNDEMTSIIDEAVEAAKKAAETHSPSRRFEREIGQHLPTGIAKGVNKARKSLLGAINNLINDSISEAKSTFDNSDYGNVTDNLMNKITVSLEKYSKKSTSSVKKLINSSIKSYSTSINSEIKRLNKELDKNVADIKADTKLTAAQKKSQIAKLKEGTKNEIEELNKRKKNYKEAGQASIKAYTDAMANYVSQAKATVSTVLEGIESAFEEKYKAIVNSKESLESKMTSFGELYSIDDNGKMVLKDIKKQTNDIVKYAGNLGKIKGKISSELFAEITNMSIEDGQKYMNELMKMSDEELAAYNNAYSAKLNASKALSEQIYENDIIDLKRQFDNTVDVALKNTKERLVEMGAQAMQGFISGMKSEKDGMSAGVKEITEMLIKQFQDELDIHSPSRVMAKKIGRFIPSGIGLGIKQNAKDLVKSIHEMNNTAVDAAKGMVSKMTTQSLPLNGSSTTNIVNNYNQTINAPKQPSRIELYRQSKNLLSLKGV